MGKLVLIDGNAILHRAYHALPPLTTKKGDPINAVYGVVSMFLRVLQDIKPTHVAFCFDRPEENFRHKEYPEYQAQRPPLEKDLSSQFEKIKDVAAAMNIPVYEKVGFEADDLIGTISERAVEGKEKDRVDSVVIVTGDRDILQLVDDKKGIRVYLPIRGLSEAKLFGVKDVLEKMGVEPSQIVDYKALVGDASDNYKGVPGIGPKTAIELLRKYKSFENIYKHLDEIPKATRKKLIEGRKSGELAYKLAKIVTNVDIEVDLDESKKWRIDNPMLLELFSQYGFKTLTNRVKEVGKQLTSENQTSLF